MVTTTVPSSARVVDRGRARRVRRRLRPAEIKAAITTLVLLPVCFVWVYPFIWMVAASIKTNAEVYEGLSLIPEVVRLDNYVRAWNDANIGRYLWNSVFVTFFSVLISVIATAMMGYVLGRYRFAGRKIVFGLLAAAVFMPEGYTIIPIFDLINSLGLANSLWGVTLAEAGGAHVVITLLFAGYFSQLPGELEESARMDGAGFFRIFWSVYLPLAKPVVATAIILQFMHSWNDFLLPLVLTLSKPELRTLAVGIYSLRGEYGNDWVTMSAASSIALLPIIILFLFLQRYFIDSIAGALKG